MARPRNTPVVSGVYFLFHEGELEYVGRSHDAYARIAEHRQKGRRFDLATVMPLAAEFIGQVEEALIRAYRPQRNRMIVEAKIALAAARPPAAKPPTDQKVVYPGAPAPDGLGTLSFSKAKALAVCMGLRGAVIDEAVADGDLVFVDTGVRMGRGVVRVARFDDIEAYCDRRRALRLDELGLAPLSTVEATR